MDRSGIRGNKPGRPVGDGPLSCTDGNPMRDVEILTGEFQKQLDDAKSGRSGRQCDGHTDHGGQAA